MEGVTKGEPLFRGVHPTSGAIGTDPINVKTVTRVILKRAAEAGLTRNYSSHSLRRGWACNLSLGEFIKRGRWKNAETASHYQVKYQDYYDQQGWTPMISNVAPERSLPHDQNGPAPT